MFGDAARYHPCRSPPECLRRKDAMMFRRLVGLLRGQGIALLALFIALGGTAYATTALPGTASGRNS